MIKAFLQGLLFTLLLASPVHAANPASVPAVADITALKALGLASPQYPTVHVNQYSADYNWVSPSTATCDNVTIVCPSPAPSTGRYFLQNIPRSGAPKCDGVTDDTAALQALFNAGGFVQLPVGTCNFTTLSIQNPIRVSGTVNTSGTPVTILNSTSTSSAAKIVAGNIAAAEIVGIKLQHLVINTPSTPGGTAVYFQHVRDSGLEDVEMLDLGSLGVAIQLQQVNTVLFRDMRIINPISKAFYIYGDDSHRSDVIILDNINVTGDSLTTHTHIPDALYLDGFVNTVIGYNWNFVNVGRGIVTMNTVGATQRGEYIQVYGMNIDFPYYDAIHSLYHDGMFFTDAYMHGAITDNNINIYNTTPQTSSNISFTGGQCTGAYKSCAVLDGRYIRFSNVLVSGNSTAGVGSYPGIELGANSVGVTLVGNIIGEQSGIITATQSYGVKIDTGATNYTVMGNEMEGNVSGPVQDSANATVDGATGITFPNIGMVGIQTTQQASPASGDNVVVDSSTLRLTPAADLAALTITLPTADHDGQVLRIISLHNVAALTLTPSGGQTIDSNSNITSLTANTTVALQYVNQTATWVRTQ